MRWIMLVLASVCCLGAAPTRDNIYVTNNKIKPNENMANEDAIFTYLQNGVDTYAPNSIGTVAIATGGVTSADILDGTITTADLSFSITSGTLLPSGAVYFMLTGSCPAGTTDISTTYANRFVLINATASVTGGASTHTHVAGSYVGAAHTHSLTDSTIAQGAGWNAARGAAADTGDALTIGGFNSQTAESGGGGAVTGTSASTSNLPEYISMKACKVN